MINSLSRDKIQICFVIQIIEHQTEEYNFQSSIWNGKNSRFPKIPFILENSLYIRKFARKQTPNNVLYLKKQYSFT